MNRRAPALSKSSSAPARSVTPAGSPTSAPSVAEPSLHRRILDRVRAIPSGRVATYGQIADLAGLGGRARLVGYALARVSDRPEDADVPWHRVINARGEVSARSPGASARSEGPPTEDLQRGLLESEGVEFDARGRVDFARFRWNPASPAPSRTAPPTQSRASTTVPSRARARRA